MAPKKQPAVLSFEQRLQASVYIAQTAKRVAGHLLNGKLRGFTMTWSPSKAPYLNLTTETGESFAGVLGSEGVHALALLKPDNRYDVEVDDIVRFNNRHWIVDDSNYDDRMATLRHVRTNERTEPIPWSQLDIVETPPTKNLTTRNRNPF